MEIIANELEWLVTDEQNLAAFLDTPTGRRLIPKLLEQAPGLLERGETNEILIRSGKVRGYQEIAQTILALAHPAPKSSGLNINDTHPDLDNDSLWPKPKNEPALDYQPPPAAPPTPEPQPQPPTL